MITVVKVVCGNGELKMGVYTSAFNKKECVGEKGENGSEERSAHPQKIKGRFLKKIKCRRIHINMF